MENKHCGHNRMGMSQGKPRPYLKSFSAKEEEDKKNPLHSL